MIEIQKSSLNNKKNVIDELFKKGDKESVMK